MKFFHKLFSFTLTYKIFSTIKKLAIYIKDYNLIADTLYSDSFMTILKRYLNKEFKKDWIGRLYAVINPNIDIHGKFNFSNTIIELNDDKTNNEVFVNNWIFKQLQLVADVFKIENLYSYITMKIEHVGPATADNFLVVFDMSSRVEFAKAFKKMSIQLIIYIIILIIILKFAIL